VFQSTRVTSKRREKKQLLHLLKEKEQKHIHSSFACLFGQRGRCPAALQDGACGSVSAREGSACSPNARLWVSAAAEIWVCAKPARKEPRPDYPRASPAPELEGTGGGGGGGGLQVPWGSDACEDEGHEREADPPPRRAGLQLGQSRSCSHPS